MIPQPSNTGCNQGSAILLEKEKKRALIKMPCRRHVIELHAVHVATAVSGRQTTGPGEKLFLAFSSIWDDLKPNINYQNLVKFDWESQLGTVMEKIARKVLI